MTVRYLAALHVISMVTWFSGLFYMGRLFVYLSETTKKSESEQQILIPQLNLMARRLWYFITWPGMLATLFFGLWLASYLGVFKEGWFHLKLLFVLGLVFYHFKVGALRKKMANGDIPKKSLKLRFFNEIPVLFLVSIVFTVYLQDLFSGIWAISVFVLLSIALAAGIFLYRRQRTNKK